MFTLQWPWTVLICLRIFSLERLASQVGSWAAVSSPLAAGFAGLRLMADCEVSTAARVYLVMEALIITMRMMRLIAASYSLQIDEDGRDHACKGSPLGLLPPWSPRIPNHASPTWRLFYDTFKQGSIRGINEGVNSVAMR